MYIYICIYTAKALPALDWYGKSNSRQFQLLVYACRG